MLKSAFRVHKTHGLIFDIVTFLGNVVTVSFVPRLGDEVSDTLGGAFLLSAVLTQIAGAWTKKGFLSARLAGQRRLPAGRFARGFMNLLLFLHFLLFTVITLFALALLGIYDVEAPDSSLRGGLWVFVALLVGGFAAYLVWLAAQPAEDLGRAGAGPGWLEFGADGLLWVSISLVTRIFWDGLLVLIEPASGIGLSVEGLVLLVAVSFLYLVFYLPGRYLYLVEDYHSVLTWAQVSAVMLPVIWLVLVG
jgi:hypothetical protein